MVTRLFRRGRSERGAELIELALVLPILLLMFAAIMDFALVFQRFLVVSNAAREGARIAVLPGYTETDVQNRVTAYVQNGTGDDTITPATELDAVEVDPPDADPFAAAQVTVSITHSYLLMGAVSGLLGGGSWTTITLTARSTMRIES